MIHVHGRVTGQTVSWFHKYPAQSNQHCLYCGVPVGSSSAIASDKEHLIGRNFVPTGTLGRNSFNFIFRACRECNSCKADAERHVSSVTLVNSPARVLDGHADSVARRKAMHDFHPDKKGVPVGKATENHSVEINHGANSMRFGLVSPPQVSQPSAKLLALRHVQALFSLATTEDYRVSEKTRLLPRTQFLYLGHYACHDWGNPQLIELAKRVSGWLCHANIAAAEGYFRAVLKRNESAGWFWALEWNQYMRVVGAIVHENEIPEIFDALPDLGWKLLPDGSGRYRPEMPLSGEDRLFDGDITGLLK